MLNLSLPDQNRRWSLPNAVFVTYTLFLAGFFFVPNAVDNYKFYVAAVFLPGLFLLPQTLKLCLRSRIWQALLIYLVYMLLSSLWSENFSAATLWRDTRYAAYILSFILLTVYWFQRNPQSPDAIINAVALVGIFAALYSVLTFEDLSLLPALTENRMVGVGITDNPNPSAFVYGLFGVITLDYARSNWGTVLAYVYAAGLIIIALFVVLTQSNTGLLALVASCSLLLLLDRRAARPSWIAALALGLGAAVYLAWVLGAFNSAMDLGFMNRIPIWQHILERWPEAPVFGHGLQPTPILWPDGTPRILNYAHSSFLSTLRDGGTVGLLLLLVIYSLALRAALGMAITVRRARYLCLFVFGIVCMLVDTDQLVTRPRELWIILWLPLSCLIAYELGLVTKDASSSPGAPAGRSPKKI